MRAREPVVVKTTRYSEEQVLRRRPYIRRAWCEQALIHAAKRVVQDDGRIRLWILVEDERGVARAPCVVLLDDGETVDNAFFDRDLQGLAHVKLHCYPETDSLYIEMQPKPGVETREVADGLVGDLDEAGTVVGFDLDRASRRFDLSKVETVALPTPGGKAA